MSISTPATGQISYDRDDRYARRLGPKDRMSFSHPILTLPDDLVDRSGWVSLCLTIDPSN